MPRRNNRRSNHNSKRNIKMQKSNQRDDLDLGSPLAMVGIAATVKHAGAGNCPGCGQMCGSLLPQTGKCITCSAESGSSEAEFPSRK